MFLSMKAQLVNDPVTFQSYVIRPEAGIYF